MCYYLNVQFQGQRVNPCVRKCANISLSSHAMAYSDTKVPASTQICVVTVPCRITSRHSVKLFRNK